MTVAANAGRALSIAEASEATGLSAHTLRYYERAGLLEPVDRNEGGHRRYRESDVEWVRFLTKLRATGMPIRDVRRYAELMKAGDGTTIPTTFYADLNDRAKAFQGEFAKRAKAAGLDRTTAAQFDAATYDIVLFYAHAMRQAKVTGDPAKLAAERTAIKDELRKMKNFPALEGAISFGSNGDALKPVYVIQLQDGKWTLIGQFPPES